MQRNHHRHSYVGDSSSRPFGSTTSPPCELSRRARSIVGSRISSWLRLQRIDAGACRGARWSVGLADEMALANVRYLGSARLADNHEPLIHGGVAQTIAELETGRQRQLPVDFALNRQFRRDVFIRYEPDESLVPASRP